MIRSALPPGLAKAPWALTVSCLTGWTRSGRTVRSRRFAHHPDFDLLTAVSIPDPVVGSGEADVPRRVDLSQHWLPGSLLVSPVGLEADVSTLRAPPRGDGVWHGWRLGFRKVELRGFEPLTPCMPWKQALVPRCPPDIARCVRKAKQHKANSGGKPKRSTLTTTITERGFVTKRHQDWHQEPSPSAPV